MFPDDIESITMTRDDYDRHMENLIYENIKLKDRIDKATKYIKKIIIHGESEHPFTEFAIDFQQTKDGIKLLEILKGNDNELE